MTLPATGFVPSGPTTEATVERVIDGDTIVVDAGGARLYVHYLGIDAPEAVALDRPVQFMGPEASQANAQLVSGQTVILERDVSEADSAARLLRDVWVDRDGTLFLVGLELVKAGFARAVPQPPDVKYQALYADAEAQAKPPAWASGARRPARRRRRPCRRAPRHGAARSGSPRTTRSRSPTGSARTSTVSAGELHVARRERDDVRAAKVAWTVDAASAASGVVRVVARRPASGPGRSAAEVGRGPEGPRGRPGRTTRPRSGRAMLTVTSTCPLWRLSVTGVGS